MANELKHDSVGTSVSQAEFEGVGLHVLDSQATRDIIYASSASQLSRLGAGTRGLGGSITVAANDSPAGVKALADYVCDGTADDVQINAAIAACAATGGHVMLSDGTFTLNAAIDLSKAAGYSYMTLSGQGMSTKLTAGTLATHFITTSIVTNRNMYITIRDLRIVGTGQTGTSHGIYLWAPSYSRIINVDVNNCAASGIYLAGDATWTSIDILVQNCKLNANGAYGGYAVGQATDVTWDNCNIFGNANGVLLTGGSILKSSRVYGNTSAQVISNGYWAQIVNNIIDGGTYAVDLWAASWFNLIEANHLKDSTTAIRVSGSTKYVTITGNYFEDNTTTISDSGLATIIGDGNHGITPDLVKSYLKLKNTSGGECVLGDVVIFNATGESFTGKQFTTTTTGGDEKVLGMIVETITDDAVGYVQVLGKTTYLKVDGTADIAIGDELSTFTTAKIAKKATTGEMVFAIALEAYTSDDSNGVIDAILIKPRTKA